MDNGCGIGKASDETAGIIRKGTGWDNDFDLLRDTAFREGMG